MLPSTAPLPDRLRRLWDRVVPSAWRDSYFRLDSTPRSGIGAAAHGEGFHELIQRGKSFASRDDVELPGVLRPEEAGWVRLAPRPVEPLGYFQLRGVLLCSEGYVLRKGRICYAPSIMPAYWREMLDREPHMRPSPRDLALRDLHSRAVLFVSRDYNNYMHWWMEIAPRLYPVWRHEPALLKELLFVIPAGLAPWCRETLGAIFDIDEGALVTYEPATEAVRCVAAILPTMMHTDYHFHPAAADFYRHVIERCARTPVGTGRSGLLYLTRRHSGRTRPLVNAAEAEALAASLGFEVVAPETLPWREQVGLFASARIVAGEHGAAMKNLLFAPSDAIGIVINYVNPTQATLAALKRQRCFILAREETGSSQADPYSVDLSRLRACLEHGLRLLKN